jgi:hypothetical protein
MTDRPARASYSILKQLVQLLPKNLADVLGKEYKIQVRKFSVWSQIVSLLYGHLSRAYSLNEICDAIAMHLGQWCTFRNATAPKRNTFANANKTRNPAAIEAFYWHTVDHLQKLSPRFGVGRKCRGFLHRLNRNIYAIDSTTIQLVLNCIDWAKHRAKKAAAKAHIRINVATMLPTFVIAEDAAHHDSKRAEALCSTMKEGDVLLADRAYDEFGFLHSLTERGIFFVVREKDKTRFKLVQEQKVTAKGVIADQIIKLSGTNTSSKYVTLLRRVTALVEVDGKEQTLVFLTNNMNWSPRTIAELYRARWNIELFFKELKQTVQLQDFIGYSQNAVKWQIWSGLLTHLLLRFSKYVSGWSHSFSRLCGIIHSVVWSKMNLASMLKFYGIAGAPHRPVPIPEQPYLQGFEPCTSQFMG